jgi:hypothetical protein
MKAAAAAPRGRTTRKAGAPARRVHGAAECFGQRGGWRMTVWRKLAVEPTGRATAPRER